MGKRTNDAGSRETGKVKWFNPGKGYGFITRDAGGDVFVHFSAIDRQHEDHNGHRNLAEGDLVEFGVVEGDKGQQADGVVVVS